MAGLERRLDEAEAALVTLEEVAEKADRTLVERDGDRSRGRSHSDSVPNSGGA